MPTSPQVLFFTPPLFFIPPCFSSPPQHHTYTAVQLTTPVGDPSPSSNSKAHIWGPPSPLASQGLHLSHKRLGSDTSGAMSFGGGRSPGWVSETSSHEQVGGAVGPLPQGPPRGPSGRMLARTASVARSASVARTASASTPAAEEHDSGQQQNSQNESGHSQQQSDTIMTMQRSVQQLPTDTTTISADTTTTNTMAHCQPASTWSAAAGEGLTTDHYTHHHTQAHQHQQNNTDVYMNNTTPTATIASPFVTHEHTNALTNAASDESGAEHDDDNNDKHDNDDKDTKNDVEACEVRKPSGGPHTPPGSQPSLITSSVAATVCSWVCLFFFMCFMHVVVTFVYVCGLLLCTCCLMPVITCTTHIKTKNPHHPTTLQIPHPHTTHHYTNLTVPTHHYSQDIDKPLGMIVANGSVLHHLPTFTVWVLVAVFSVLCALNQHRVTIGFDGRGVLFGGGCVVVCLSCGVFVLWCVCLVVYVVYVGMSCMFVFLCVYVHVLSSQHLLNHNYTTTTQPQHNHNTTTPTQPANLTPSSSLPRTHTHIQSYKLSTHTHPTHTQPTPQTNLLKIM